MTKKEAARNNRKRRERDDLCRDARGIGYEYNPEIDLDDIKYALFKPKDCTKVKVDGKKKLDKNFRYIINAPRKPVCEAIGGHWRQISINREDPSKRGVCWRTKEDKICSTYEDECSLRKDTKSPFCKSGKRNNERSCNKAPGCKWTNLGNYEDCVSKTSIIASGNNGLLPPEWPKDITVEPIQTLIHKYYNGKMSTIPPSVQDLLSTENRCDPDYYKKTPPRLTLAQSIIHVVSKGLAMEGNVNRGILAWQSTGAGKTLTATSVMDAFWDTDRPIFFVSSVTGKANNPASNFYDYANKFFPRFGGGRSGKGAAAFSVKNVKTVEEMFKKRKVEFKSYAEMAHILGMVHVKKSTRDAGDGGLEKAKMTLRNAVVIIDEVHSIFKPLPNHRREHDQLRKFLLADTKYNDNMKLIMLTATPGESLTETVELLNYVRTRSKPPIAVPDVNNDKDMLVFRRSIKGLVSFFDPTVDYSKFPVVHRPSNKLAPMSNTQYEAYIEMYTQKSKEWQKNKTKWQKRKMLPGVAGDEPATVVDDSGSGSGAGTGKTILKSDLDLADYYLLASIDRDGLYYEPIRKVSNMLAAKKDLEMQEYSSKLPLLLAEFDRYKGEKHYAYSAFYGNARFGSNGIVSIAEAMLKMGYEELTADTAFKVEAGLTSFTPKKRFAILSNTSLTKKPGEKFSSRFVAKNLHKIVDMFNSEENRSGEFIHVLLATDEYREGIDLKGVRHIHMFEPLVTYAMEKQTIGRAVRDCSHKHLKHPSAWTVKLHRYFSTQPINMKMYDTSDTDAKIQDGKKELEKLALSLEDLKGKKGVADQRKKIKDTISITKNSIKELEKSVKKVNIVSAKEIEMIDEKIYNDSRTRINDLMKMFDAMRDSAIDCIVMKDLHKRIPDSEIKCVEEAHI